MASLYEDHAKELAGVGDEYRMASWKHKLARGKNPERLCVELIVAPLLADGTVAWKYSVSSTRMKVEYTFPEHDAWVLQWEQKTGRCSQCSAKNPGQEWVGWNHITGTQFKVCSRCNGTGSSPAPHGIDTEEG